MTRYKPAEFVDEDTSSIGSVQLNESRSASTLHMRFRVVQVFTKAFDLLFLLIYLLLNKRVFDF